MAWCEVTVAWYVVFSGRWVEPYGRADRGVSPPQIVQSLWHVLIGFVNWVMGSMALDSLGLSCMVQRPNSPRAWGVSVSPRRCDDHPYSLDGRKRR